MSTTTNGARRGDRLLRERVHDPYKTTKKLPDPTVCPVCNAVFTGGHWQWKESWPMEAPKAVCHACRRTQDGYPAGILTFTGAFARGHKQELLQLARHQEKMEMAEHPMHRILKIEESRGAILISTTDIHLPKRIGGAVHHAYKGKLDSHYDEGGYLLRMTWNREE
jgi:hypothetical protein